MFSNKVSFFKKDDVNENIIKKNIYRCLILPLMAVSLNSWSANFTQQSTGVSAENANLFSVHEIVLNTGDGSVTNPFDTDITVTFKSPDKTITVNSFYDDGWGLASVEDADTGLGPYSLTAGTYIIRITQRERNSKIDQLQITRVTGL